MRRLEAWQPRIATRLNELLKSQGKTGGAAQRRVGRRASVAVASHRVTLKAEVDCDRRYRRYRRRMNTAVKTAYDVYCLKADPTLRIAVAVGAGLPKRFKAMDWKPMARGSSLLHSDASRDIGVKGYCYFQVTKGG